jgi:hypothetical protein
MVTNNVADPYPLIPDPDLRDKSFDDPKIEKIYC